MSSSTNTLAALIAALEQAAVDPAPAPEVASSDAEDLNESLLRIPRTPQFWAKELRDLARCRAIVDRHDDKMVDAYINTISNKVDCTVSKSRITPDFLETIMNLSYSATIDFINAFEERLKKFGHDLPDALATYRIEIGLGDDDSEDHEDNNA